MPSPPCRWRSATVTIENFCGQPLAPPFTTSINGRYAFKLDMDCCYNIKATQLNYFAGIAENVCTKEKTESETLKENLFLQPTNNVAVGGPSAQVQALCGGPGGPGPEVTKPLLETPYTYYDKTTDTWMDKDTRLPADGTYPDG